MYNVHSRKEILCYLIFLYVKVILNQWHFRNCRLLQNVIYQQHCKLKNGYVHVQVWYNIHVHGYTCTCIFCTVSKWSTT